MLWPIGVPWGNGLRFYDLPQKAQSLYTMNGGRPHRDIVTAIDVDPWRVSGGMHHIPKGEWSSVKGLDLSGPIDVWEEWTDVGAFGPVPKVRWRFPEGTLAYDVLIRRKDGRENVFEIRVHERMASGWDSGTVYRPKVDVSGAERRTATWAFANAGIDAQATYYSVNISQRADISSRAEFVATRTLAVDDEFTPAGYVGAGTSCNSCHSRVGEQTGYAQARRGSDGRFSWHPFTATGGIDGRWPIRMRSS